MPRISLTPPRTPLVRLGDWYSRRSYGDVLAPGAAMGHNPRVLMTYARMETSAARWKAVDEHLKALGVMAAAVSIGCSWCIDFGYWETTRHGLDPAKARDITRWRDSAVYSDLERRVMAYAEAMSGDTVTVTDEMVEELRRDLTEAQLVELTMMISVENLRARFNSALGLTSQGFTDRCEVPA